VVSHQQSRPVEQINLDQRRAAALSEIECNRFSGESSRMSQSMRTTSQAAFEGLGFAPPDKICDFAVPSKKMDAKQGQCAQESAQAIELAQAPVSPQERRERSDNLRDEEKLIAKFRKIHEVLRNSAEIVFETQGIPAEQAILAAAKKNAITFVGETHTYNGKRNPNREMLADLMKDLPKGSRLAIELPDTLKPVFEQFNKSPQGSDLVIPEKIEGKYGQQACDLLRAVKETSPDLVRVWIAARDAGIQVVPINNEWSLMPPGDPDQPAVIEARDQYMKDRLKGLYDEDKNTPIVAWLGSLHGALRGAGVRKWAAQLLAEDEQFRKSGGTVTSFHTQIAEEGEEFTLHPLTDKFKKPLSVPTYTGGQANAVGVMSLFENPLVNLNRLADFDNVIVYPRAKAGGRPAREPLSKPAPAIGRS
jgi:hypothetical protein